MTGDPEFTDEQLIAAGAEDPNLARPVPPVVHRMPAGSDPQFPCCGRWVQENLGSRMTEDPAEVTCTGGYPLTDEQLIEAGAEDPNAAARDAELQAAYERGYRHAVEAAAKGAARRAGSLIVGPDDYLVINLGERPTAIELEMYSEMLKRELPGLEGRVLLTSAASMAVVKGVPDADPLG